MATAATPDLHNVQILPNAEEPPSPERRFPNLVLTRCVLVKGMLADQQGGDPMMCERIVEIGSERTWLFERRISRALYGEVWRAVEVDVIDNQYAVKYDEGRTRRVAVKRMPMENIERLRGRLAEDPVVEISALVVVSDPGHPNVLRKEAALYDGRTVYLVTRFVDGGEIFQWIADNGGAYSQGKVECVRNVFRQLVQGMKYTHSKGICHADMSLENAMVDMAKEKAYIIDYGMSLLMPIVLVDGNYRRRKSIADRRRAKASYCSPETFKNKAYDGVKVDVFAAGAMLFMMLTGFPPFERAMRSDRSFRNVVWRGNVAEAMSQCGIHLFGEEAEDLEKAVDLLKKMMAYAPEDRILPEEALRHPWLAP